MSSEQSLERKITLNYRAFVASFRAAPASV
jgi:hypothetical protein